MYAGSGEVVRADVGVSVSSRAIRKRRILPDELFDARIAEAYRRAGSKVHLLREQVEQRRLGLRIEGVSLWSLPSCLQVQGLCAWNAFALQTLGEALLGADGAPHSRATATQTLALFAEVEPWLSRGLQAGVNEEFALDGDVPASLPVRGELELASQTRLAVMLRAMRSLRHHAEVAASILDEAKPPPDHPVHLGRLCELRAQSSSAADYAEGLYHPQLPPRLCEQVQRRLWTAIHGYYLLGQLLNMPHLEAWPKTLMLHNRWYRLVGSLH